MYDMDTLENAQKRAEYWKAESIFATKEIDQLRTRLAEEHKAHCTAMSKAFLEFEKLQKEMSEAIAVEREACAQVCEGFGEWRESGDECARAIRARSDKWDEDRIEMKDWRQIEQVKVAETAEEMRAEIFRLQRHDPMVRSIMDFANYRGLSAEDRYVMLAYNALKQLAEIKLHVLEEAMRWPSTREGDGNEPTQRL